MKRTDLAWLAGIFDGEGSAGVYKYKNGYCFRFSINNTDPWILKKATSLVEKIGRKSIYRRIKQRDRTKPCGEIVLRDMKAIMKIFRAITPYLVGKKIKAQMYIEGIEERMADSHYHKINTQWIMDELVSMNGKN